MFITPPNCPAVWVACSIARSEIWPTGFQAMKLGIVAFLTPFVLLVNPGLLLIGSPVEIIFSTILSIISVYFLAAGLEGYSLTKTIWWQRIFFLFGGVALFVPHWYTRLLIAPPLLLIAMVTHIILWRRSRQASLRESYEPELRKSFPGRFSVAEMCNDPKAEPEEK